MATKKVLGNMTEAELKGKTVFLRADLDVLLHDDQKIAGDNTRIRASVPTIKFLTDKGAKVILTSHRGRPKGVTPKFSLKPLVPRLSELLEVDVVMANDCVSEEDVQRLAATLPDGGVLFLENAMFYEEEEKGGSEFAKKLASVADIYVKLDAFMNRALPHGELLPGVFAFDINDGMAMKHGLLNNSTDDDDFAYEDTSSGGHSVLFNESGVKGRMLLHISNDNAVIGHATMNVHEGKGQHGLPDNSTDDDFAYEDTSSGGHSVLFNESGAKGRMLLHISNDDAVIGHATMNVQEGEGPLGVFEWSGNDGSVATGGSKVIKHI